VACTELSRDDSIQLSVALNTYANFLSMCLNRHEEALEKLKKVSGVYLLIYLFLP
jgi:hypothetical protein